MAVATAAGVPNATAMATTASRYVADASGMRRRSSRTATASVVRASATTITATAPATRRTDVDLNRSMT